MAWLSSREAMISGGRRHISTNLRLKLTILPSRSTTRIPSAVASRVAFRSESVCSTSSSTRRRSVTSRKLQTRPTVRAVDDLGKRVALDQAAVLELEDVVADRGRLRVDGHHLLDEGGRILELLRTCASASFSSRRSRDVVGNLPHVDEAAVEVDHLAAGVDDQDPVRGRVDRGVQERDRPLQLVLGALALGHVEGDADDAPDRAVGVAHRIDVRVERAPLPGRLVGHRLPFERPAMGRDRRELGVRRLEVGEEAGAAVVAGLLIQAREARAGGLQEAQLGVGRPEHRGHLVDQDAQAGLLLPDDLVGLLALEQEPAAKLQLRDHQARERAQRLGLLGSQAARLPVQHADRPDPVPVRGHERRAGVEADPRISRHERVGGEAGVRGGVRNDEDVPAEDRVRAERHFARRLGARGADPRLEPLPLGVDQGHRRHGRPADLRGEPREIVERLLGRSVENGVAAEGLEPLRLVVRTGRRRGLNHGSGWRQS